MSTRQKILDHLNALKRPADPPPVWQSHRSFDDLAAQFTTALQKAKGEVHRAESLEAAMVTLSAVLEEIEAKTAVFNNQPPLNTLNLAARWPDIDWHMAGQSEADDFRAACVTADIGLTGVEAALAETGTAVVSSGPGRSRLTPLLPPVHLALVATSQLTADLFTWTAARSALPPAAMTLVSGPSKTADIEQTMAIGVHGPKRFIVILYSDTTARLGLQTPG
jgi:L-lactate dehydrogenase complex protein LldG